jgi:phospholipid/cholesterol/gamma-HCH transport system substrate-binding protein
VRGNLTGAVLRLTVFAVVCLLGLFSLLAVFAQLRFENDRSYNAIFANVSGLKIGDFVRIAGVEVGKVKKMTLQADSTVRVEFNADDSVALTQGSRASVRYDNLIGDRYLALEEGAGSPVKLPDGGTIAVTRTSPALDLDALVGGFRPLFQALNPDQINALSGQLVKAFQGEGATIGSVLSQTAAFTSTLADRDELIGRVISNLNVVLGTLSDQGDKLATTVDSLSQLIHGLSERKVDISNSVAYTNAAASSVADLLSAARQPFQKVAHETDRTAGIIDGDRDYVENVLATLPDDYKALTRLGLYGDYFSFYICDLIVKVNGKGGQPVYIKLAGQSSGRCTPK